MAGETLKTVKDFVLVSTNVFGLTYPLRLDVCICYIKSENERKYNGFTKILLTLVNTLKEELAAPTLANKIAIKCSTCKQMNS